MILNEMKILVIEDQAIDLCAIKNGLLHLRRRKGIEHIEKDNIITLLIDSENDLENIVSKIKTIDPDILFVDLYLVKDIQDGINILDVLVDSSSELKYLPKYIISGADKVFNNSDLNNIFQFAYPIKKPDLKKLDGLFEEQCDKLAKTYHELFEATHQLNETLPIMAGMYKAIREKFDINRMLTNIEYKIDAGEITNEQIIGTLQIQSNILEKIKITTTDIKERTKLIEIITTATAKALPKIADKEKAKKLIDEWEKNDSLKNALGTDFPEIPKGLYDQMKKLVDGFNENAAKDIGELLYEAGKEYINEKADINDEDTKIVILMKYSAFFTEKVTQLVK